MPCTRTPLLLRATYGLGQFYRQAGRALAGAGERRAPGRDATLAEGDQAVDIAARPRSEND